MSRPSSGLTDSESPGPPKGPLDIVTKVISPGSGAIQKKELASSLTYSVPLGPKP